MCEGEVIGITMVPVGACVVGTLIHGSGWMETYMGPAPRVPTRNQVKRPARFDGEEFEVLAGGDV